LHEKFIILSTPSFSDERLGVGTILAITCACALCVVIMCMGIWFCFKMQIFCFKNDDNELNETLDTQQSRDGEHTIQVDEAN
jgi:hypothetical protein